MSNQQRFSSVESRGQFGNGSIELIHRNNFARLLVHGLALLIVSEIEKGWMKDSDQRNSTATLPHAVVDHYAPSSGRPNAADGLRLLSRGDQ